MKIPAVANNTSRPELGSGTEVPSATVNLLAFQIRKSAPSTTPSALKSPAGGIVSELIFVPHQEAETVNITAEVRIALLNWVT